jgi:hypothetical protein
MEKNKLSFILITLACLMYGCSREANVELEQGHYSPKIDVAEDMKNPPIEQLRRSE